MMVTVFWITYSAGKTYQTDQPLFSVLIFCFSTTRRSRIKSSCWQRWQTWERTTSACRRRARQPASSCASSACFSPTSNQEVTTRPAPWHTAAHRESDGPMQQTVKFRPARNPKYPWFFALTGAAEDATMSTPQLPLNCLKPETVKKKKNMKTTKWPAGFIKSNTPWKSEQRPSPPPSCSLSPVYFYKLKCRHLTVLTMNKNTLLCHGSDRERRPWLFNRTLLHHLERPNTVSAANQPKHKTIKKILLQTAFPRMHFK